MSKFITNLKKYWDDLEESYDQYGKDGESRLDYIKRLIGYEDGKPALDPVKARLLADYEGNEVYADAMSKVFDSLSVYSWEAQETISNLNDFVQQVVSVRQESSVIVESELSSELLDSLNPYLPPLGPAHVVPSQQLAMYGTVMDVFKVEGEEINFSLVDGFSQDGFIVFKSSKSEELLLKNFKPEDPVWATALKALLYLGDKIDNVYRCVMVTKEHYTRYAGELKLSVDKERYPLTIVSEIDEAGKRSFTHCKLSQAGEELDVVCLG